jgi:predicted MFS family arabinose efflux permease
VSLWRNRDFTAYWVGEAVSSVGTQVTFVALPLVAILTLDVGVTGMGVLRFAEYLPFLAFTLLFGVWADRRRRRPLMIVANLIRVFLAGLVPLCAVLGLMRLPLLVMIAFAIGTCTALYEVCWLSYVPSLVDRDDLMAAMGKVSASHSASEVAGPGLGGLLVQWVTAPFALLVDAASYAAAAFSLVVVRRREPDPRAADWPRRHILGELAEGLRFAFGNPYIRATAYTAALGNFFSLITETVFLVYAVRNLHLSPGLLGMTMSAIGVGGLLGASSANTLTRLFPLGPLYTTARMIGSAGTLLLPLARGSTVSVVATCMVSFFIWQAALGVTNVVNGSLRQVLAPAQLRGRTNASVRTLVFGALPLGGLAGGLLGSAVGLHWALWIGALGYALSIAPILLSPLPRLQTMPS